MSEHNRPTSPHLDIYRWRITMLTSILHRASGVFIYIGLVFIVFWLFCLADGDYTPSRNAIFPLFWFFWTAAIYYHLCNGIRHLLWDVGKGFSLKSAAQSGKAVFIVSAILTLATWIIAV